MKPRAKYSSNSSNRESPYGSNCIDWYLITTVTLSDGTTFTDEQYIGTTCGNCGYYDPNVETEDCNGSGGGGSYEDCCVPADVQLSSESISQNHTNTCGLEGIDPNTSRPVKSCVFSWRFLRNTLAFYTWSYISREQNELEKINGVWKFKNVQHTGMDVEGTIPPCISFSCNINSATSSISADRLEAQMNLTYTTTFNVTCCPWCSPSYWNSSSQATWNSQ